LARRFRARGVEAIEASVYADPPPVKTEAALRVCAPLLEARVANRANWTIPRLIAEIKKRELVAIGAIATLQGAAKKKFRRSHEPREMPGVCGRL
jgi:hypothetical protein